MGAGGPARVLGIVAWVVVSFSSGAAAAAAPQVIAMTPARNRTASVTTPIAIEFDRAVDPATITMASFRAFGRWSGSVRGSFGFGEGGRLVTLTPGHPFSAGETVFVNLSHDITAADGTPMRQAGFAYQFSTAVEPSQRRFAQIDVFSDRTAADTTTRIYGAMAPDLNNDGFLDLAVVNEDSADVRVFLNRGDGSGRVGGLLTTVPIDDEASPNETADFDNDGNTDACIAATNSRGNVWVLLGEGDGTFRSVQEIDVGTHPRGIAVLDADGDGDMDIVNANIDENDLSLLINDGTGHFTVAGYFDGGVDGEFGLTAGDMNNDGIADLIVGGRDSETLAVLLGNGDGTFTAAGPSQSSGGHTWVVVTGDLDGDGNLDVATANSTSNNGAVLLGDGGGSFGAPALATADAHIVSSDLGDLDGDGDLDWVLSSYGGSFWRIYVNDGKGNFTFDQQFASPANASCAVLYDADNDGDLDMALTDEVADVVLLMKNTDVPCTPAPRDCAAPGRPYASLLRLRRLPKAAGDSISWKWAGGADAVQGDFGDPRIAEDYALCLYAGDRLAYRLLIPAAQACDGSECWTGTTNGFVYRGRSTPNGVRFLYLGGGRTGRARAQLRARGSRLALPDPSSLSVPVRVQLQNRSGSLCWGAAFTPPFLQQSDYGITAAAD